MVIALSPGVLLSSSRVRIRLGEGILAETGMEHLLWAQLTKILGCLYWGRAREFIGDAMML